MGWGGGGGEIGSISKDQNSEYINYKTHLMLFTRYIFTFILSFLKKSVIFLKCGTIRDS